MMTEAPTPPPIPQIPAEEHRLHPFSGLFISLNFLKHFIVPAVIFMLAGPGRLLSLWWLAGGLIFILFGLWEYLNYRYRLLPEQIEIRRGLLSRQLRQIAYARIHNVALHQSLLHRLFGVAEVRLESAGGTEPEAHMRVLRLDKALALEQLVRERGQQAKTNTPIQSAEPAASAPPLLALPITEIIRHGLISNRGMVVVAAIFATFAQFMDDLAKRFAEPLARSASLTLEQAQVHTRTLGWLDYSLIALVLLIFAFIALRVFSVVLSLLQYHGFVLAEAGRRLTVSRGLLTRIRSSTPKRRIQAWHMKESWLHRRFKRRALSVDTAVSTGAQQQQGRGFDELAPIATPAACDALINHLLPTAHWPPQNWQPLHRLSWLRRWLGSWLWVVPVTAVATWKLGNWGLLPLAWLPVSGFAAWQAARHTGWSLDHSLVATRSGWLSKQWRFTEVEKLQSLRLDTSPLDQLFGMRSLLLDTAGAKPLAPMRISHLKREDAEALYQDLTRKLARSPLRW